VIAGSMMAPAKLAMKASAKVTGFGQSEILTKN
jgi:hypothetical protein